MKYGSGGDIFNSVLAGFKWDETCARGDCITAPPPPPPLDVLSLGSIAALGDEGVSERWTQMIISINTNDATPSVFT